MSTPLANRNTAAYYFQAVASFIVSTGATVVGIAYLPVNAWERAFLGLGLLYTITSAITLAKVVRDKQEDEQIVGRVDKARLDKLLSEHDPYRVDVP
ncbi:YiaA/YiaB family inner membrane protein [Catenulispora rubra]|uniref:YiaA/YiaB family inner membrane protein n=1 Tax=Catenulispora rubra TaxID=280293 RepID=UPI001892647F|nr:YiaA/YiaB family inner membrane protein [Catenulispora rubra]